MFAFRKAFALFDLDANFLFSDVVELWKRAGNVLYDVFPSLYMKTRTHLRYFSNYNPRIKLGNVSHHGICVNRVAWGHFKTDWTHVMVVAMIDIRLVF